MEGTQIHQFNSRGDNVARIIALISIFFIPFSESLNNLFGLAVFVSLFSGEFNKKLKFIINNKMTAPTLILATAFAVGALYSTAGLSTGIHQFWKYAHKLLYMLLLMPLFIEAKWRRWALNTFFFSLFVAILYVQFKSMIPLEQILTIPKHHFIIPIPLSVLTAFACFVLLNRLIDETVFRWGHSLLFIFMTLFLFLINIERTGMLVYIALCVLIAWQRLPHKYFFSILCVSPLLLMCLYLASNNVGTRVDGVFNDMHAYQRGEVHTSIGLRLAFLEHSIALIKTRPLMGYGLGSFAQEYERRHGPGLQSGDSVGDPHNSYFHIAVQLGIVGLSLFLFWLFSQWRWSRALPQQERFYVQGLLLMFMVSSLCVAAFLRNGISLFYCPFLGIFYASLPANERASLS